MEKKWLSDLPYLLLGMLIILFLMTHSPNSIDYDALSYINFTEIRPPLYPIFIGLFHWAGKYQYTLIVWIHAVLTFSALLYARSWLKIHLKINDFLLFIMCLFVTITILFHFQLLLIGAEGLTFPFFIWTFFLLIECFQQASLRKVVYLSLWVAAIILTRLQFYYFYAIFIILIAWYLYKRVPLKHLGIVITVLLTSILLTNLVDRSYHYFKFDSFSVEPETGQMLMVQALYLTGSKSSIPNFQNPNEKQYVVKMLEKMHQQKLNQEADLLTSPKVSYYENAYEEYNRNYLAILNVVFIVLSQATPNEVNIITQNISKALFLHSPKKNLFFILWKFITFVGGIQFFIFFLILISALVSKIFVSKDHQLSCAQLFVSLVVMFIFLNAATVALFETYQSPYFCYTQFLLYCLAAYFADLIFFKDKI